jgi:four helix bundle protein
MSADQEKSPPPRSVGRTHRDLIAWQAGMQLLVEAYRVARQLPDVERYGLASQLRRASVSIAANIAEGFGRYSRKDFVRHLSIATGALREMETHLEAITLLEYLPEASVATAERAARRTAFLLRRLQRSLSSE